LIDLHSHTTASDGSCSPEELIGKAVEAGLEALAITDHDTLDGYDAAAPHAHAAGLDLICGVELSTKFRARTVHLLGYFLQQPPTQEFRDWLRLGQESRRDRNRRLIERLQSLGVDITLAEVQAIGRTQTGRPHFARVMLQKGYVSSLQQAFDEFLDVSAKGYVERQEPKLEEGIQRILEAGGLPSLAHPVRMAESDVRGRHEEMFTVMSEFGLRAIEVYHSDHGPRETARYRAIAERLQLEVTGGSDFHGDAKPRIRLGRGRDGNLNIPRSVLDRLRAVRIPVTQ
jgi:predicted metal-dependent phosphoesterase TrpH